jgi:hypothetical protein
MNRSTPFGRASVAVAALCAASVSAIGSAFAASGSEFATARRSPYLGEGYVMIAGSILPRQNCSGARNTA